ncbi:MAG TPA: hypothetical protein VI895_07135 [Bdellovibrionota bacterium]|nr:hypothetical protein [Bdellovibrionota bacterium]
MRIAAVTEFKSKLARYLRMVKSGEKVEIQERGVPIAILTAVGGRSTVLTTPPRKNPKHLASMTFSVRPKKEFDVVEILLDDRRKR